jgi:DNA ligase-1
MITKPMKACTIDLLKLVYPVIASPKLDGIRCLKLHGKLLSASFKPIPNRFVNDVLTPLIPDGFDGELVLRGKRPFNEVSSAIMSRDGEPAFEYQVFDYVIDPDAEKSKEYHERIDDLKRWFAVAHTHKDVALKYVKLVKTRVILNVSQLENFEAACCGLGYEGVMVRCPTGLYKSGRATPRLQWLIKIKRFRDSEAIIVGYEQQKTNCNPAQRDELGRLKRSTAKAGMRGKGVLGAFLVQEVEGGVKWSNPRFSVGTGFTAEQRVFFWRNRKKMIGKIIKYKYQPHGAKDSPRIPVFLGFRDPRDMGAIGCNGAGRNTAGRFVKRTKTGLAARRK